MRALRIVLGALAGFVLVAYAGCTVFERQWYLGMLPAAIQVDGVVSIADSSGFREGCGAAVFSLAPATLDRLRAEGAAALSDAHQARSHVDAYHAFGTWRETPHVQTGDGMTLADRWLSGMDCGGLGHDLQQQIFDAIGHPGSYYATAPESGLIVIPALKLVVLSYFG